MKTYNRNVELFDTADKRDAFIKSLETLVNQYGVDNALNIPDFAIADWIYRTLCCQRDFLDAAHWFNGDKCETCVNDKGCVTCVDGNQYSRIK